MEDLQHDSPIFLLPLDAVEKQKNPKLWGDGVVWLRKMIGLQKQTDRHLHLTWMHLLYWASADVESKLYLRWAQRYNFVPKISLSSANLAHANLPLAELSQADFSYANLSHANLLRAALGEANLFHANLSHANLSGVAFLGTNLGKAKLVGADLCDAFFVDANISGADFTGARRHSRDSPIPGWKVVDGLLARNQDRNRDGNQDRNSDK